ncbi:MAG: hypothetical protein LBS81_00445 [Endomicrobium sp.]|jgi:hypothetical protein|nr:hypothetical protein [Endomicrobium sp.]
MKVLFILVFSEYLHKTFCLRSGAASDLDFLKNNIVYTYGFAVNIKHSQLSFAGEEHKISNGKFSKYTISFRAAY